MWLLRRLEDPTRLLSGGAGPSPDRPFRAYPISPGPRPRDPRHTRSYVTPESGMGTVVNSVTGTFAGDPEASSSPRSGAPAIRQHPGGGQTLVRPEWSHHTPYPRAKGKKKSTDFPGSSSLSISSGLSRDHRDAVVRSPLVPSIGSTTAGPQAEGSRLMTPSGCHDVLASGSLRLSGRGDGTSSTTV